MDSSRIPRMVRLIIQSMDKPHVPSKPSRNYRMAQYQTLVYRPLPTRTRERRKYRVNQMAKLESLRVMDRYWLEVRSWVQVKQMCLLARWCKAIRLSLPRMTSRTWVMITSSRYWHRTRVKIQDSISTICLKDISRTWQRSQDVVVLEELHHRINKIFMSRIATKM